MNTLNGFLSAITNTVKPDLGQFRAEQSHPTAENHQVAVSRVTLLTHPRPKSGHNNRFRRALHVSSQRDYLVAPLAMRNVCIPPSACWKHLTKGV